MDKTLILRMRINKKDSTTASCSVVRSDGTLQNIKTPESALIFRLVTLISDKNGFIISWFECEGSGPFPRIVGEKILENNRDASENVYWKYYDSSEDLHSELAEIWNNFGGVRIYPANNVEEALTVVKWDFEDTSDEKRLGMNYQDKWYFKLEKVPTLIKIPIMSAGFIWTVLIFILKLGLNRSYRNKLSDPFGSIHSTTITSKCGAYFSKAGHDEIDFLEFLAPAMNVKQSFIDSCTELGFTPDIKITETL